MLVTVTVSSVHGGGRDIPDRIRARITLAEPDHVDLFTIETPVATDHTAEDWARAILEQAPVSRRNARRFWRTLGLRLGPPGSPDHVQGWRIAARHDDWLRLETASFYMTAEAVCLVEPGQVSLSLSVRHDRPPATLVWAAVADPHQRAVPVMLRQAVALMTESPR
jgi:hypothetical protein